MKNLNKVFEHYIEKFEWLNQKHEPDESYKWVAVKNFQSALDLDVADIWIKTRAEKEEIECKKRS